MSGLIFGFAVRMRKRAVSAQGETTLGAEAYGEKRPRLTCLDEKAQKSLAVINVDSQDRAFDAQSASEGAPKMPPERLVHHRRMGS